MEDNIFVYDAGNNFEYYDDDPAMNHFTQQQYFLEVCRHCVLPAVLGTISSIATILLWAVIFRVISLIYFLPVWTIHIASCFCGLATLYVTNTPFISHIIGLGVCSYLILLTLNLFKIHYRGFIMSAVCFVYLLSSEFLVQDEVWRQIRGTQMIIVMKAISLCFDIDKQSITVPSTSEYFGYTYSVANILFGPWMPYQEYSKARADTKLNMQHLVKIFWHLLVSFLCLTISNCWGYWLIPDENEKWLLVYRDALLFRTSHYFISHLSLAVSLTTGYNYSDIVNILAIELPSSLVQVVVHWNIPMHKWLKHYVFKPSQKLSKFWSILCVYIASAALHGFSAALAVVLLSLGFYTYVEYMLRHKVALAMSCCVLASPCKENCHHIYNRNHLLTICINLFFMGLTILHLAYLGVIFEEISLMRTSNLLVHTFNTWAEVGFISHIIMITLYIVYLII